MWLIIISIILSDTPIVALGAGILSEGKEILIFAVLGILVLSIITSKARQVSNLNSKS